MIGHPSEDVSKELGENWNLQKAYNLVNTSPRILKRMVVPINDIHRQLSQTEEEGGCHWSLLICDILASNSSAISVNYCHFDSCEGANKDAANKVAMNLHQVCAFFVILIL